jgi:hypothetical protein
MRDRWHANRYFAHFGEGQLGRLPLTGGAELSSDAPPACSQTL